LYSCQRLVTNLTGKNYHPPDFGEFPFSDEINPPKQNLNVLILDPALNEAIIALLSNQLNFLFFHFHPRDNTQRIKTNSIIINKLTVDKVSVRHALSTFFPN